MTNRYDVFIPVSLSGRDLLTVLAVAAVAGASMGIAGVLTAYALVLVHL